MYTLNLAELPATKSVEFLVWVVTNQIGNYRSLIELMTKDIDWYYKTSIPFVRVNMLQKSLYNHKWQYNGGAPWDEIRNWCQQNIKGHSYLVWDTIWFASEQDYVLFLLRWS